LSGVIYHFIDLHYRQCISWTCTQTSNNLWLYYFFAFAHLKITTAASKLWTLHWCFIFDWRINDMSTTYMFLGIHCYCLWTIVFLVGWLADFPWLKTFCCRWNIGHRPLFSIQLCSALPPSSSFSCTCILLSTSPFRADLSSRCFYYREWHWMAFIVLMCR